MALTDTGSIALIEYHFFERGIFYHYLLSLKVRIKEDE